MESNKIFVVVAILFFTGLSIGVVLFLVRVKEMNKGIQEVKDDAGVRDNEDVKDVKGIQEVKDIKGIQDVKCVKGIQDVKHVKGIQEVKDMKVIDNPLSNSIPIIPIIPKSFKNSSSQTPNDPIYDLLQILKKEDDSFAFTRGEDGNLLLICSLKIPFESILSKNDDDFSNANLRKVIRNAVSQYISIRNPDYNQNNNLISSNFLKLLYTKKESFIGSRINRTFMPDDIFEIVKKTIRGLREFYKSELSKLNKDNVICLLYNLEDKINNSNNDKDDDDSYNTFLSLFFTNDHFDFIQDVRNSLDLYEKKKKYLLNFGLEGKHVLCTQDNPKMDYDILDFIIYVSSKVLTNTISKKIY